MISYEDIVALRYVKLFVSQKYMYFLYELNEQCFICL